MAQMQSFSIVRAGHRNVPVPTYTITALVYDDDRNLVADFTGANALSFPACLDTFTTDEMDEFLDMTAQWVVLHKAGIPYG